MSVPVIAFFNNKGAVEPPMAAKDGKAVAQVLDSKRDHSEGVGKTSLVYHLAWMFADLGAKVVAADLDPQANLTAAFVDDDELERLWNSGDTIYGLIEPLIKGIGDVRLDGFSAASGDLVLLPGDLRLSTFEDELSTQWPLCLEGKERAFRVESAFWRVMQRSAEVNKADLILVDLGPNLGHLTAQASLPRISW